MTEIDVPRQAELKILERQKPMNAVIDRGDSAVQQFYRDAVVFVTGGSGFVGKQLIEKLFRSCDIKRIYTLMRPKKGKTIQQRLQLILKDPLYDTLRKKKPNFAEKLVPVEGDVAEIRLGLSKKDWSTITGEVNVIIHLAATVRFDEPLRRAGLINVRGTREMMQLGRECTNLKLFNHISTAFAHAVASRMNTDVMEQFYPCPISPTIFLEMIENMDEVRLNGITPGLIQDWPNTYTFTKALSEELIRTTAGDLPICIVKPPVVTSSYVEPAPGWIDGQTIISSPVGFLLGGGLGVMHVLLDNLKTNISLAPIDYVNNAIIAAGWDSVHNRKEMEDIPIYTVSSSNNNFKWGQFGRIIRSDELLNFASPKALWYCYGIETNNRFLYWFLTWILHYIPAFFLDAVVTLLGVRPKGMPTLLNIYKKVTKLTMVYHYFFNDWNFKDDNVLAMIQRMSPADRAIYHCDVRDIELKDLIKAMCIGVRRYILKDGLKDSAYARKKQMWLKYANILFLSVYAYLVWKLIYVVYSTFAMVMPS